MLGRIVGVVTITLALGGCADGIHPTAAVESGGADVQAARAAGAGIVASVTGSGHRVVEPGTSDRVVRKFTVSANAMEDGTASGRYNLVVGSADLQLRGGVTCVNVVGDRAFVGGNVDPGYLERAGRRDEAVATLVALSDLLRRALTLSDVERVPLREELSFARSYLEIQRTRFGERLRVNLRVPAEAEPVLVPALLLQPLVENAVRHGVDPERGGGCVSIAACLEAGRLVLTVTDSGRGDGSGREGFGIGLRNVRDRLARLYGSDHALELRERPEGGSEVRVVLPARSEPGPDS